MSSPQETTDDRTLRPDALLDMTRIETAQGAICALLTPAIKGKFQEMSGGQILEVRVNDPTAREDIASWCRLSGHELVAEVEESPQLLRVFIRKRES
ncbi:MAG TPA: sulfurtransferase TusA family protein [Ktedonobacterales bacterium]|nr:sulfurtransferase TusA family protein [Ktedonobacterales bacterium]